MKTKGVVLQFPDISASLDSSRHCRALNYHAGVLVSGRLNDLINLLIPVKDSTQCHYPDRNYTFAFVLCCRLFISPESVLERIFETTKENIRTHERYASEISIMVIQLLQEWVNNFPHDFKKSMMLTQFKKICSLCRSAAPGTHSNINQMSTHLVNEFDDLLRYMSEYNFHQSDYDANVLLDITSDAGTTAKQLTIIELEKISKISPEQYIERFIAEDITVSNLDLSKATSSLEIYVSWFNRLSMLVASEVCDCSSMKGRVKIINFFIDVGWRCLKVGNFNSAMAIIVGLNTNSVLRMTRTWKRCNGSSYKRLERIFSPDRNFYRYRKKLGEKLATGCELVIPVFSLFVKDLYVLNQGMKDRLANNLINFQKSWHLANKLSDMIALKNKICTYPRDGAIFKYLMDTPVSSEDMLYKASFEVEPPTSEFERNRYQSVRLRLNKGRTSSSVSRRYR